MVNRMYLSVCVFSDRFLPTLDTPMRSKHEVEQYCPCLEKLTDAELDKKIRDQDRNAR